MLKKKSHETQAGKGIQRINKDTKICKKVYRGQNTEKWKKISYKIM